MTRARRSRRRPPSPDPARRASSDAPEPAQSEKLQKVLADLGYGSRREMEQWIAAGRVEVNGIVATLGTRVSPADGIQVDGRPAGRATPGTPPAEGCRVLVLNKPVGVICTRRDPEGRPTVFDDLPRLRQGRWISVGRLDIQTSGLLLLTNDGALAHRMMHPSTGLDREYAVRVNGRLEQAQLEQLVAGVEVEGEVLHFSDIQYYNGSGVNHWYHVVLMEGRNREVRRLFESMGLAVSRLKRVRFGPVVLPSTLRSGRCTEMIDADLKMLYELLKLPLTLPRRGRRRSRGEAEKSLLLPYPELPSRD